MNWKSFSAIVLCAAALGYFSDSARVHAQAEQTASNSVESRLAAIEKYLHMDDLQKTQNIVADAKTFDELKAAMIKLDTEQDMLARRIRTNNQAGATEDSAKAVEDFKRDMDAFRANFRAMEERVRKLEQKTR